MCCDKFDIYYCGPYFHTKCIFCLFSTNFYIHAVFFWQIGNIVKNQRALVSEVKLFEIITFFFFLSVYYYKYSKIHCTGIATLDSVNPLKLAIFLLTAKIIQELILKPKDSPTKNNVHKNIICSDLKLNSGLIL